ncbi:MAG TPA: O-antigen ligase family protein [Acidimicrobiales bacterium]|nr:O-antigen ligase family protein [Acidimicrobiales bacterium]
MAISADRELGVTPSSVVSSDAALVLMMTLLGMTLALDRFVPFHVGGEITVTFLLGTALGTLGFWLGVTEPVLRRFLAWIAVFFFVAVVSVVANGRTATLAGSGGALVWLLLMPGVASLCLERRRFRGLLIGLVLGAAVLLAVVVWRFARGARILDAGYLQLLGLNRNAVDMSIVWLIPPVLWSRTLGIPRLGRALFVAAATLWLVSSEGRTGLLALLMVPFVFLLVKPSSALSRATKIALVATLGALLYLALTSIAIPGLPATQRLAQYDSVERTESDQIRLLLNEKSLALAGKHPVTGVGWGLYEGQYDPVVDKGSSAHVRQTVLRAPAHNTYYEVLATTGLPGFLLYFGALLVPLIAGIRTSWDPDVRALTAGYVIVLFSIGFHSSFGSLVALPVALLLAAVARAVRSVPPAEA